MLSMANTLDFWGSRALGFGCLGFKVLGSRA